MKKSVWTDEEGKTETVQNLIEKLFSYAMDRGVSDIHAEPLDEKFRIRCRRDGVLESAGAIRKEKGKAFINRLKVMAALDIADARRPQDGRIVYKEGIDMRLSTMPTVRGEKAVIRILGGSRNLPDLDSLGMDKRAVSLIRKSLRDTKGLIIICGPTGSGKTTTLYAALREIDKESVSIATLEDPVEYKMDGVNQIQVNAEVGLTFASGLRSILRQDPDIVMVGEIRDNETANLAIQAALTGHLVFSTLHTNSAAGVLPRLLDMGIEPFLIASTVNTIIGQRLVRRVARRRDIYQSSPLETQAIREAVGGLLPQTREQVAQYAQDLGYESLPLATQTSFALAKGKDTPQTPRGYAGRAGLYEVMDITEEIQNLIVKRATSAEIQRTAIQQGMITMRQDGYLKALNGITTIEEVNRVAADTA